jgi:site-specific recombinase XerC
VADALVQRLRTLQATSTSPLIFAAPGGGFLHRFQDRFRQAVRAAGLDRAVTPHCLRHTWASRFMETSGDLLLLQKAGNWVRPRWSSDTPTCARGGTPR